MKNTTHITAAAALTLSRFEFIALFLVVSTRRAEQRKVTGGLQVRHAGGVWSVVQTEVAGGVVTYQTGDAALLFDYVRRGALGSIVRDAEDWRLLAHEDAAQRAVA
jgi:hypothetical protein